MKWLRDQHRGLCESLAANHPYLWQMRIDLLVITLAALALGGSLLGLVRDAAVADAADRIARLKELSSFVGPVGEVEQEIKNLCVILSGALGLATFFFGLFWTLRVLSAPTSETLADWRNSPNVTTLCFSYLAILLVALFCVAQFTANTLASDITAPGVLKKMISGNAKAPGDLLIGTSIVVATVAVLVKIALLESIGFALGSLLLAIVSLVATVFIGSIVGPTDNSVVALMAFFLVAAPCTVVVPAFTSQVKSTSARYAVLMSCWIWPFVVLLMAIAMFSPRPAEGFSFIYIGANPLAKAFVTMLGGLIVLEFLAWIYVRIDMLPEQ